MKTTGEAVGRQLKALFLACVLVLLATLALAQDIFVTNAIQLCQVSYSGSYSMYLPDTPWSWRGFSFGTPIWLDCTESNLPCAALFPGTTNIQYNGVSVNVATPTLVRDVFTGVTTISAPGSTDIIAQVPAPDGWYPGLWSEDRGVVWMWNQWTNCPDCWGEPAGGIIDPTVTLAVLLANAADYDAYASNVAAQAEVQCQTSDDASVGLTLTAMAMDGNDMDDGDPCTITNEAAPFSIVSVAMGGQGCALQWTSCTDHIYVVQSESSLTPTSSWTDVAWMFGTDQQTSWTDTNAVGLTQNFYQVVRGNPNTLNNGIPYWWIVSEGAGDPLDPNLASEVSTNPWAHGLTNLQVYENPSVLIADNYSTFNDGIPDWWRVMYFGVCTTTNTNSCAACDLEGDGWSNLDKYLYGMNPLLYYSPFDFIVNGGQPYTASLNVPIQPIITNLPSFLVSLNPTMGNGTLFANSGGSVNYTLPNNGDGGYELYLQYADAQGQPVGPILSKVVVLDQTPPVVYITSPASTAILNQGSITLQAVAADPNPVVPDGVRQLSIWINGQRFWDRDETNITIERFPVPVGTNSFTVTILAVDPAGNTNTASQTWPIDLSTATNAPNMLTVNLSSPMLLPNVNSIWVEGTVDNDYALINAIVFAASGDVTTNLLNVRQNQYEGSVPLESGTNQLALAASDAAGNTSSNVYTIISSTEFSGAITNPVFGTFATAPSNYVSGYVSALYDAGLPTQTNVTTVTVNGVAAVLGTNQDAYGNIPFWTTNAIPLGVPITATIGGPGIPTDPPTLPPLESQVYEVTHKGQVHDDIVTRVEPCIIMDLAQPSDTEGSATWDLEPYQGCWIGVGCGNYPVRDLTTVTQDWDEATSVVESNETDTTGSLPNCLATLDPDSIPWNMGTPSFSSSTAPGTIDRGLSFGTYSYDHGAGSLLYEYYGACGDAVGTLGYRTLLRALDDGSLRFLAPREYGSNTTVLFTFEGVNYRQQDGATLDLSQIQFRGQSPAAYSNETQTVSYWLTVNGGQEYTICQDDFTWPPDQQLYHQTYSIVDPGCENAWFSGDWTEDMHWLQWTNFHNHSFQLTVQTVGTGGYTPNLGATAKSLNLNYSGPQINATLSAMHQACLNAGTLSVYLYQGHAGPVSNQPAVATYTGTLCSPVGSMNCTGLPTYTVQPFTYYAPPYYLTTAAAPSMPTDFTSGQGMPPIVLIMSCGPGDTWPSGFIQAGAKVVIWCDGEVNAATATQAINDFFATLASSPSATFYSAITAANADIEAYNQSAKATIIMNPLQVTYGNGISSANTFADILKSQ